MRGISICVRKTRVQVEQRDARNAMNNRTDIISLYGRIIIINCYYYDVIVIVTVCGTHMNYSWSCADSHHLSYESPSLNCLLGHSSVLSLRTSRMTVKCHAD